MATATKPAPFKLSPKERARLTAEHLVLLNLGKICYKRSDVLLDLLTEQPDMFKPIKLTKRAIGRKAIAAQIREAQKLIVATLEGRKFAVRDQYAEKKKINVGMNARRFEVDEVSAA